ncbi:MAG: translation initiation factor IF-2, partial [Calditrichaeota bacterium]|nr:translation initiation factor IF-2 [Calditrichota bacterium]
SSQVGKVTKFIDFDLITPTEKEAREVSLRRQRQHRELSARKISSLTLEQASRRLQEASLKELPLLIKGDVHGSIEVLSDALMRLSTAEVKVEIIHRGVGGINESDALLAAASGAVIIGFHVHPNLKARELARKEGLEIRLYRIIHEVVDDIRATLEGMLAPLKEEKVDGRLKVRQVFKVSRLGTIAGSYVLEGKIKRNSKVRLIRDDIEIWTGNLGSLKRFKDDAKEVLAGFECGIALDGHRDIRVEDIIEVFSVYETKRTLEESS